MYGLKYPSDDATLYEKAVTVIRNMKEKSLKEAVKNCGEVLNQLPVYQKNTTVGQREMEEFLLSARGVLLFQTLVLLIKKYEYKQDVTPEITPVMLAVELEEWIVDYCGVWRKSSQESELFRIIDFIADLCKILRRYEKEAAEQS